MLLSASIGKEKLLFTVNGSECKLKAVLGAGNKRQ